MFAVLHLFENFGLIVFQNFFLSVTFLTSMLLKFYFLLLRKRLIQILRCFLYFSMLMVVLSKFYLLFNIMAFVKVLFMKGLLSHLRYFCFEGANFSRVKLRVVLKLLRESSVSDQFFISLLKKFTIKILITAIKYFFTFTFGKGQSANRHYQFMVSRCSRLYRARFHKKGSHICNNMINGRRISTHVTSWCFKMT